MQPENLKWRTYAVSNVSIRVVPCPIRGIVTFPIIMTNRQLKTAGSMIKLSYHERKLVATNIFRGKINLYAKSQGDEGIPRAAHVHAKLKTTKVAQANKLRGFPKWLMYAKILRRARAQKLKYEGILRRVHVRAKLNESKSVRWWKGKPTGARQELL
jgi:hypothetical protein